MKSKILVIGVMLMVALTSNSQFVVKPLNYQVPGDYYVPVYFSIVDNDNTWIGTNHFLSNFEFSTYTYAVHTTDRGETWIFDSIPVPGLPAITSVSAVDENICYYTFIDNLIEGDVWKTIDGGSTWDRKTTNEFNGGFLNFYHAFNADDGIAVGDPNGGYFEIYRTTDGGDTWIRITTENIPEPLEEEYGYTSGFAVNGNTIWFSTWKGRCFKSEDQGQTWTVSSVDDDMNIGGYQVTFSTPSLGVFFDQCTSSNFWRTSDGGISWVIDSLQDGRIVCVVDAVDGFDGGFVVSSWDEVSNLVNVFFTPDFFSSIMVLDSNLASTVSISFDGSETGWLGGSGYYNNAIFEFSGIITSLGEAAKRHDNLSIVPNPSSSEALIKIPTSLDSKPCQIFIQDMSGKTVGQQTISNSTGWFKLNAMPYSNGIYIIEVFSDKKLIATERWIISH